jgi:hypothetical protein
MVSAKEETVQEARLHRLIVAVIVTAALLCLAPTAHASPPDPTWIAGFYDNADFDDVALLITNTLGVAERSVRCSLCPERLVTGTLLPTDSDTRPLSFRSSALSRAPPVVQIIVVGSTNAGILAPSPWSLTRLPRIDTREEIPPEDQAGQNPGDMPGTGISRGGAAAPRGLH